MANAGHELLFCSVRNQLISSQDVVVSSLHWCMVTNDFKCIGNGEKVPSRPHPRESLPADWNASQDVYMLLYQHNHKTYLLKIVQMDSMLLVHLMRHEDEKVTSMSIKLQDFATEDFSTFHSATKNMSKLQSKVKQELLADFVGGNAHQGAGGSRRRQGHGRDGDDPLRIPPTHAQRSRHEWDEQSDPFAVGGADLDPFGRHPGGGGMLMDPRRGGLPGVRPDPSAGLPGRLPPGAVPPGARFDPFGPQTGNRPGPDPDHLPPPGYDDMFM